MNLDIELANRAQKLNKIPMNNGLKKVAVKAIKDAVLQIRAKIRDDKKKIVNFVNRNSEHFYTFVPVSDTDIGYPLFNGTNGWEDQKHSSDNFISQYGLELVFDRRVGVVTDIRLSENEMNCAELGYNNPDWCDEKFNITATDLGYWVRQLHFHDLLAKAHKIMVRGFLKVVDKTCDKVNFETTMIGDASDILVKIGKTDYWGL